MNRKLSSAYADAVLDFLETGARQGIVFDSGLFVFRSENELTAEDEPLMWVDERWIACAGHVSAPSDPAHPDFSKLGLRAQIIDALVDSEYIKEIAAQFGAIASSKAALKAAERRGAPAKPHRGVTSTSDPAPRPASCVRSQKAGVQPARHNFASKDFFGLALMPRQESSPRSRNSTSRQLAEDCFVCKVVTRQPAVVCPPDFERVAAEPAALLLSEATATAQYRCSRCRRRWRYLHTTREWTPEHFPEL